LGPLSRSISGIIGFAMPMDKCDLFSFRDRYTPPGYKTASEILNFKKVSLNL
jgi:hypothetical protein